MSSRILIANRGEIACRVIRACHELNYICVAVYASDDKNSPHVQMADFAFELTGQGPAETYNNITAIICAAKATQCIAIHPGYGFLAEKAEFAAAVEDADLAFIGPRPETLKLTGDKVASTEAAKDAGLPVLGQSKLFSSFADCEKEAKKLGFPLFVKSPHGGGGLGCHRAEKEEQLQEAYTIASSQGQNLYGSKEVYVEQFVKSARHIEVQTMGDGSGKVIHVGTRECSVQRRRQKVIEEAPAQRLCDKTRNGLHEAAIKLMSTLKLRSAATVEFLVEGDEFWFLEVNPRIQVEHPVTELVYGVDLVQEQLHIALGEGLTLSEENLQARGYAIEGRVYAEDPVTFIPAPGEVHCYEPPQGPGLRIDDGIRAGSKVTPFYDPLLAKTMAWAPTKKEAANRLCLALKRFIINGTLRTNLELLIQILAADWFLAGSYDTTTLEEKVESLPLPEYLPELAAQITVLYETNSSKQVPLQGGRNRFGWKQGQWKELP